MLTSSSKQRLKLAHEVLDKQLSNNSFTRTSIPSPQLQNLSNNYTRSYNHIGNEYGSRNGEGKNSLTNSSMEQNRNKNVQSEISQLERKLMELEKKMENIDVSSSNQDEDIGIVRGGKEWGRNSGQKKQVQKQQNQREKEMQKLKMLSKNLKLSAKKKDRSESESAEEDSIDDGEIYARIQSEKQRKKLRNNFSQKPKTSLQVPAPKISVNKQPIRIAGQPSNPSITNNFSNINKKVVQRVEKENPLRASVTSKKSGKSIKSIKSIKSQKSLKSQKSRKSSGPKNLQSSSSNKIITKGLSSQQLHTVQMQTNKQLKKISNLERQLNHYKRLCQKQGQKIEEYRVMEIQYRKLESNFNKSEQIRKQQKKIIQNLKNK